MSATFWVWCGVIVVILLAAAFGTKMLGIKQTSAYDRWPLWKRAALVVMVGVAAALYIKMGATGK